MTIPFKSAVFALAVGAAACNQPPTVETAPIGSDVQVTRQDGVLVEGKLKARSEKALTVDTGKATREVPRADIAEVRVVDAAKPVEPPPVAKFRDFTIPEGTRFSLELITPVSSDENRAEDPIEAALESAVKVDGVDVLPAGAPVRGVVASVEPAGKVKGRASVALQFRDVKSGDERYPIDARFAMTAPATKKDDAMKVGIPAAGGAIIGAIIGGKKGAAIGAGVGGGGGAAAVVMTPGKAVELARGAVLSVTLDKPVEVRVPVRAAAAPR
jgi:hypothetical protein